MIWNLCRLGALMMVLGGCSLMVMRGADPKRDRQQEPKCSESFIPIYIDGFSASLAARIAVLLARLEPPAPNSAIAGAVTTSLVFTASAFVGRSRYKDCRRARADWHAGEAIKGGGAVESDGVSGYFCTSSPSHSGLYQCVREREACEQLRTNTALPDSEVCAPRDKAWCFDINATSRCFGTQYACDEHAAAAVVFQACTLRP